MHLLGTWSTFWQYFGVIWRSLTRGPKYWVYPVSQGHTSPRPRHTEAYQHRSEVITTPYRHPKKHKDDIESSIKELLAMGHIRSSSIPFTSSVVLVKKKDGTMCMCIDYRTLNERIIKNRCPIPSIDELLDELHGAVYFTKIDLCSRYCYHRFLGITRRSCLEAHRS